jgi:hypothetical protein
MRGASLKMNFFKFKPLHMVVHLSGMEPVLIHAKFKAAPGASGPAGFLKSVRRKQRKSFLLGSIR